MSSKRKKRGRPARNEFRKKLYEDMEKNPVIVLLAVETYSAWRHREHIHRMWTLMRSYPEFKSAYCKNQIGRMLDGRDSILMALSVYDKLYRQFERTICEKHAIGDAYAVALRFGKDKKLNIFGYGSTELSALQNKMSYGYSKGSAGCPFCRDKKEIHLGVFCNNNTSITQYMDQQYDDLTSIHLERKGELGHSGQTKRMRINYCQFCGRALIHPEDPEFEMMEEMGK